MNSSNTVLVLVGLVAVLALIASGSGLLWVGDGEPVTFTTLRGQRVQLYGRGLYRYDSLFNGAGNRGVDAIVFFLAVPLLIACAVLYRRGSLRGGLMLLGTLGYLLYVYVSFAFNAAYNPLFLVYVALFASSFFAFILAFASVDLQGIPAHWLPNLPRRGLAIFMFAGGAVTLFVWGEPLVTSLLRNHPPPLLDSYTTMVTYGLDLAIITPCTFLCGILVWRREPLGYVIAFPLLVLIILLLPQIGAQTMFQLAAGVSLTPGQIIGPIAGFAVLGLVAAGLLVSILRNMSLKPLSTG